MTKNQNTDMIIIKDEKTTYRRSKKTMLKKMNNIEKKMKNEMNKIEKKINNEIMTECGVDSKLLFKSCFDHKFDPNVLTTRSRKMLTGTRAYYNSILKSLRELKISEYNFANIKTALSTHIIRAHSQAHKLQRGMDIDVLIIAHCDDEITFIIRPNRHQAGKNKQRLIQEANAAESLNHRTIVTELRHVLQEKYELYNVINKSYTLALEIWNDNMEKEITRIWNKSMEEEISRSNSNSPKNEIFKRKSNI